MTKISCNTFKSSIPSPEGLQCKISAKIYYLYSWQPYQFLDKKFSGSVTQL